MGTVLAYWQLFKISHTYLVIEMSTFFLFLFLKCGISNHIYYYKLFHIPIIFSFSCVVNLGTIGYSISVGWMGIQFIHYDSDESPLPTGRVPVPQLGWVASILGIGGLAGTIAAGCMADRFGRKYSLLVMALPEIVSIISIYFTNEPVRINSQL